MTRFYFASVVGFFCKSVMSSFVAYGPIHRSFSCLASQIEMINFVSGWGLQPIQSVTIIFMGFISEICLRFNHEALPLFVCKSPAY